MDKQQFIENYKEAFANYELPLGVWYSNKPVSEPFKTRGCFIKDLKKARTGQAISFSQETIACIGGKVYSGFSEVPDFLPNFVSGKECYKESPGMVMDFVSDLKIADRKGQYLNFAPIDLVDGFDKLEGLIFFATPDVLTGLVSWALYDSNKPDAVSVPFGSGCSLIIAQLLDENRAEGHRTFLGMFDPSVRPQIEENILSFAVPMSRFRKMYTTFGQSCLKGAHAWSKVRDRIKENGI